MTNDRFIPNRKFSRLHDMPLDELYCKQQSFSQYSSKINEFGKFNNKILTNKNNNYSHHISGFRNHIIKKISALYCKRLHLQQNDDNDEHKIPSWHDKSVQLWLLSTISGLLDTIPKSFSTMNDFKKLERYSIGID